MSTGLATRRALDRAARMHQRDELRGMQLVAGLVTIATLAVIGTGVVLLIGAVADAMTGLTVITDAIRSVRGLE